MAFLHQIKRYDMENSYKGASVSLWFNHCPHKCIGCWNEETWERDKTLEVPNEIVVKEVLSCLGGPFNLNTLALLGGDPLSPLNIKDVLEIVSSIKKARPETNIICWTGFRFEQLQSKAMSPILEYIDVLIDGRFILDKKIEGKKYGSSNQRVIDVKKTISNTNKEIVLMEDF